MSDYTIYNLNSENFFRDLTGKINKIEFYNDTNEAFKILRDLRKAIQENEQKIKNYLLDGYKEIIIRLRFILFLNQSDNEVLELFKEYLIIGIKMIYIDLLEALKIRISFIPLPNRDEYKKQILMIILNNQEEITKARVEIKGEKVSPTIAAWLKSYNSDLGTGPKSNLEQSKYFLNNKNFTKLEELEKLELKELFSIYEYLKRSSAALKGNEDNIIIKDVDEQYYILQDGGFIDISLSKDKRVIKGSFRKLDSPKTAAEEKIEELKKEEERYGKGGLEKKAIEEEIEKEKKIAELRDMAGRYPEGSLEKKAIEEEMRKYR